MLRHRYVFTQSTRPYGEATTADAHMEKALAEINEVDGVIDSITQVTNDRLLILYRVPTPVKIPAATSVEPLATTLTPRQPTTSPPALSEDIPMVR